MFSLRLPPQVSLLYNQFQTNKSYAGTAGGSEHSMRSRHSRCRSGRVLGRGHGRCTGVWGTACGYRGWEVVGSGRAWLGPVCRARSEAVAHLFMCCASCAPLLHTAAGRRASRVRPRHALPAPPPLPTTDCTLLY